MRGEKVVWKKMAPERENKKIARMVYPPLQIARKYLQYYFTAANGKGHGIHSPFVYDLVRNVLNAEGGRADAAVMSLDYAEIENFRKELRADKRVLTVDDLGAGSASKAGHRRSVGDIAKRAAKPKKLGQLLYRIAQYYQPQTVVELGTSLGLSSAYLASGAADSDVFTIEGSNAIADVAAENFQRWGIQNITLFRGNFDTVLGEALDKVESVDLAFVDGNHREEPTLRYFNQLWERMSASSVLIFDDIHWSTEMESAWETIKADPRVYLTVDLFFLGLVFRRDEFKVKQDFTIRF